MLKEAPITYKQMALDCVTASLRVDGRPNLSPSLFTRTSPLLLTSGSYTVTIVM